MMLGNLLASDTGFGFLLEILAFLLRKLFEYTSSDWSENQKWMAIIGLSLAVVLVLAVGYVHAKRRSDRLRCEQVRGEQIDGTDQQNPGADE